MEMIVFYIIGTIIVGYAGYEISKLFKQGPCSGCMTKCKIKKKRK